MLPETARHSGRFDLAGAFTSTFGMGALVFGLVRAATDGWSDRLTLASFIVGVLLLAAFLLVELRAEEPITPLRLLANASRSGANVARGLLFAGMFGMFFFLTQFLQDVLGYSPLQTGFAFLPIPLTVLTTSQFASRVLVQRVNGKLLMLTGVGLSALGLLVASRLSADSTYLDGADLPAAVRHGQRAVVPDPHLGGPGRCRAGRRRCRLGPGQRHPAARRHRSGSPRW